MIHASVPSLGLLSPSASTARSLSSLHPFPSYLARPRVEIFPSTASSSAAIRLGE